MSETARALPNWLRLAAAFYIYDRSMRRHLLVKMRQVHGRKVWVDQIVSRMPRDLQNDLRNRIESESLDSAIEAKHFPHILKNNVLHFPELTGQLANLKRAWKIRNRFAHPAGHSFDGTRVDQDIVLLLALIGLIPGPGKEEAEEWERRLTSAPTHRKRTGGAAPPAAAGADLTALADIRRDVRSIREAMTDLQRSASALDEGSIARRLSDSIRPQFDALRSALEGAEDTEDGTLLEAIRTLEARIEQIASAIQGKGSRKRRRSAVRRGPDRALKSSVERILNELGALRNTVKGIQAAAPAVDESALVGNFAQTLKRAFEANESGFDRELGTAIEPMRKALEGLASDVKALPAPATHAIDESALARRISEALRPEFETLRSKVDAGGKAPAGSGASGPDKPADGPVTPVDDDDVGAYRRHFAEARSGNGWTHTTVELGWRLTRWVGKSRGTDRAVVFAPSRRDESGWVTAGSNALVDLGAGNEDDAFRQLCEAERRGDVFRLAKEAIAAHETASPSSGENEEDVVPF